MYSRLGSGEAYFCASRSKKGSARRVELIPAFKPAPALESTRKPASGTVWSFVFFLVIDFLNQLLIMRPSCPDGEIGRRASFRY